ncbi:adenylate/guanylate cyclase domain-containing protein [Camelimonas sp. ID_303_24]
MAKPTPHRYSLQIVVAVTFVAIIALILGGLTWFNHRSMAQLAHREAQERFTDLARQIRDEARDQLASAHIFLKTIGETATPSRPDDDMGRLLVTLLRTLQETTPSVLGVLAGWPDGSLVLSQRLVNDAAAPGAAYEIVVSTPDGGSGRFLRRSIFLNAQGEVIRRNAPVLSDYDARKRTWYQMAVESRQPVTPAPYRFATFPEIGVTVAQRSAVNPGVVFGIDVLLSDLDDVLSRMRTHPRQELVLFTAEGELAAHPDGRRYRQGDGPVGPHGLPLMSGLPSPLLRAIAEAYQQDGKAGSRIVHTGSEDYLVRYEPGLADTGMITAIAIPQSAIMGAANDMARRLLTMGLLALLIALPIVALAARRITRPLHTLTGAVSRIVSFQGDGARPPPSHITEIDALSGAVGGLQLAMNNFMRYVPQQIVRGIVRDGVQPSLGGVRQQTTVVFSDIANFTGIAEQLPPEALTGLVSRYFAVISSALVDSGATIDKFIGDSVMAFWNAPDPQPDHVARACNGVLDAARSLEELNATFRSEGLPELHTRFGVHTGEAVIGHVGSFDRLSYTVLGHTVNIASRLEALNKEFGTTILASSAVRDGAGDGFIFHDVGLAGVRGASERIAACELVGRAERTDAPDRGSGALAPDMPGHVNPAVAGRPDASQPADAMA